MKTTDQLYEELRAAVDNGNESMTHEDALEHVQALQGPVEALDNLAAALETVLTSLGKHMAPEDRRSRHVVLSEAERVLTKLGRRQPQPYTVLVLRPDYMATNYGQDTFLAHVEAAGPAQAQRMARQQAADADHSEGASEDYYVLLVLEGHQYDRRVEE